MQKEHQGLCEELGYANRSPISDSQLRRLLAGVDYQAYNGLNNAYFGIELREHPRAWQAVDGKELRGSIDGVAGEKRGENLVHLVSHQHSQSEIIGFYSGNKESEKTVVKAYFAQQQHLTQAYSRIGGPIGCVAYHPGFVIRYC